MNSGSAGAGRPDALDIGERGTALAGAPPAQEAEGGQRPGVRARVTPAQGTGSGRGESGGLPQVRDARRAPGCPHSPGTKLGLRQRPLGKRGGWGGGVHSEQCIVSPLPRAARAKTPTGHRRTEKPTQETDVAPGRTVLTRPLQSQDRIRTRRAAR